MESVKRFSLCSIRDSKGSTNLSNNFSYCSGNLLSEGVNTYAYNHANRLVEVSGQKTLVSYRYNGLGDCLNQTVDEVTTDYTLDLAAGLTQVLDDGEFTYLYGSGRVAVNPRA